MKKVAYLFVMIVGMTLASVNAQDAKSTTEPVKKEVSACCKSGEKASTVKCGANENGSKCAKEGSSTCPKVNGKAGACCKSKTAPTASKTSN